MDQVRNGNRWRVAIVDIQRDQIGAERLTDNARALFNADYFREHVTLGYATTLHAAQGVTVGTTTREGACFTVLSENASRAMAYVGMTRGKDENHAYIYQRTAEDTDHNRKRFWDQYPSEQLRRGTGSGAARYFRAILANDDRPRGMHAEAQLTSRDQLPRVVANVLERNDQRRQIRAAEWLRQTTATAVRERICERILTTGRHSVEVGMNTSRELTSDCLEL